VGSVLGVVVRSVVGVRRPWPVVGSVVGSVLGVVVGSVVGVRRGQSWGPRAWPVVGIRVLAPSFWRRVARRASRVAWLRTYHTSEQYARKGVAPCSV
jgi:hypothetical protein